MASLFRIVWVDPISAVVMGHSASILVLGLHDGSFKRSWNMDCLDACIYSTVSPHPVPRMAWAYLVSCLVGFLAIF